MWHYESGLIPLFVATTGGVGVLVGIGTAMAIGGVIALTTSLLSWSGSPTYGCWNRSAANPQASLTS